MKSKVLNRKRRQTRIRSKVSGVSSRPRLHVFRSNKAIACQLIDDVNSVTLASASSREISGEGNKSDVSKRVGSLIAEKAKAIDINNVVFDRGGYLYHGRIKALAEGARESGLNF